MLYLTQSGIKRARIKTPGFFLLKDLEATMKCPHCEGKGYIEMPFMGDGEVVTSKIWCEHCHGTGKVAYDGKREGVEWERE